MYRTTELVLFSCRPSIPMRHTVLCGLRNDTAAWFFATCLKFRIFSKTYIDFSRSRVAIIIEAIFCSRNLRGTSKLVAMKKKLVIREVTVFWNFWIDQYISSTRSWFEQKKKHLSAIEVLHCHMQSVLDSLRYFFARLRCRSNKYIDVNLFEAGLRKKNHCQEINSKQEISLNSPNFELKWGHSWWITFDTIKAFWLIFHFSNGL